VTIPAGVNQCASGRPWHLARPMEKDYFFLNLSAYGILPNLKTSSKQNRMLIPVVISMFRLPDFLTGENVMCGGLKL
jgi:hypothetical protein